MQVRNLFQYWNERPLKRYKSSWVRRKLVIGLLLICETCELPNGTQLIICAALCPRRSDYFRLHYGISLPFLPLSTLIRNSVTSFQLSAKARDTKQTVKHQTQLVLPYWEYCGALCTTVLLHIVHVTRAQLHAAWSVWRLFFLHCTYVSWSRLGEPKLLECKQPTCTFLSVPKYWKQVRFATNDRSWLTYRQTPQNQSSCS